VNKHNPQVFSRSGGRAIIIVVTFLGSLALRVTVAAAGNEIQAAVDSDGVQTGMLAEISSDPVRTLNPPNGFTATQYAIPTRLDMLRGGPAGRPPPICVWINGDYGEDKGRNYLEGGMSAQFVFRKNARYPLIVAIPTNVAVGEEEYWFGPHFSYMTTGVNIRVPLSFISSRCGKWTVGGSADLCSYGTTTTEFVKSVGLHTPKIGAALAVDF